MPEKTVQPHFSSLEKSLSCLETHFWTREGEESHCELSAWIYKGKSYLTKAIAFCDKTTGFVDERKAVDVILGEEGSFTLAPTIFSYRVRTQQPVWEAS